MIDSFPILLHLLLIGMGIFSGIVLQWFGVPSRIRGYILSALVFSTRQLNYFQKRFVKLEVRGSGHGVNASSPSTEKDNHYIFQTLELPVSKTALILSPNISLLIKAIIVILVR